MHTLPETNGSHLKVGHPKRKRSYSNHPFSGAMLVSGRVLFFSESMDTSSNFEGTAGVALAVPPPCHSWAVMPQKARLKIINTQWT